MILGIDVGSTNTDAVIVENAVVLDKIKTPTDRDHLFSSLSIVFDRLLDATRISALEKIILSSTISTNAVVENKMSPVGMVLVPGPGLAPTHFTFNELTYLADGYVDHRGLVTKSLDLSQIREVERDLGQKGINNVGICGKFSPRNPTLEKEIAGKLQSFRHLSLGHRLSGGLNFPRRAAATFLNASLWETYNRFADQVISFLRERKITVPVLILKADGGTCSLEFSRAFPVQTILSGPAAGIMGIMAANNEAEDFIAVDIGGTTTDITLFAGGIPVFEPAGATIGPYKTCIRGLRARSIGIGGDSKITLQGKNLKIGPEREGPPAALGGPLPTPTDAFIVLGHLEAGKPELAGLAIASLALPLGMDVKTTAKLILEEAVAEIVREIKAEIASLYGKPVYTIGEFLLGRRFQPTLLKAVGGPAPVLAPLLAAGLGLGFSLPPHAEVANAVGAARARESRELTLLADTERGLLTIAEEGHQQTIPGTFSLREAKALILEELSRKIGASKKVTCPYPLDIIEEGDYPVIRDNYRRGRNIRVKAQVRPGLTWEKPDD